MNMRERARRELDEHQRRAERHEEAAQRERERAEQEREEVRRLRAFLAVWDELAPENEEGEEGAAAVLLAREGLSQLEGAKIVLRQAGKALGATDIAKRMLEGGFRYDRDYQVLAKSLRGVLSQKMDDDPELTKPGHGLYGLTDFERPSVNGAGEQPDLMTQEVGEKDETSEPV